MKLRQPTAQSEVLQAFGDEAGGGEEPGNMVSEVVGQDLDVVSFYIPCALGELVVCPVVEDLRERFVSDHEGLCTT
jgi:hypothetical protein